MLKLLRKGNNILIGFCQKTRKIECIYVEFKNLKVISKRGQDWPQS